MPDRLVIDASTGEETRIPLTAQEEAAAAAAASEDVARLQVEQTEQANKSTLEQRAENALATNRTYIDRASPTTAQTTAQVKALTQQMNGVIRLLLGRLDGTD